MITKQFTVQYDFVGHYESRTSWPAYSCSQYHHVKCVFDTSFGKISKPITSHGIERIVQEHKCGKSTVPKMVKTFSFTEERECKGQWHPTIEHILLNCVAQEITLSAINAGGPYSNTIWCDGEMVRW